MTVICAIKSGDAYAIAADGLATGNSFIHSRKDRKINLIGDVVLGFAGSMRLYQDMVKLVEKYAEDRHVSSLPEAEVIDEIVERSRVMFKEHSKPNEEDGDPPCFGSHYLLGVRGCLVEVNQDLSYKYITDDEPIVAIGSGCDFALGAAAAYYFASTPTAEDALDRVHNHAIDSVRVACWHDSSCGGTGSSIVWYGGGFSEITSFDTKLGV